MKRLLAPAVIFISGLALCQILFFLQVHASNLELLAGLAGLDEAGYLSIPAQQARNGLGLAGPAFFGALFFTCTTGAGLVFLALAVAWVRRRVFPKTRVYTALLFVLWLVLAAAVNQNGINPEALIVFILIPPAVYWLAVKWLPETGQGGSARIVFVHVIVILAASLAWMPRMDKNVFLDIRDFLLLSHPAGKAVNDFYYRYTLYPAYMFKPLHHKTLKPCHLNASDPRRFKQVASLLISRDYLPVDKNAACQLVISEKNGSIGFASASKNTVFLETSLESFKSDPGNILLRVSKKSDQYGFFREFTMTGLATAFPLGLYVLVHAAGCLILFFIRSPVIRSTAACLLCLCLALACLLPLGRNDGSMPAADEIRAALGSDDWRTLRNGLKSLASTGKDPFRYGVDAALMQNPHIPVRYWMARCLAGTNNAGALDMLIKMTDDPHTNVACAAWASLGHIGKKSTQEFVLERIKSMKHWYIQQYAYYALRNLGWKQNLSHLPADP